MSSVLGEFSDLGMEKAFNILTKGFLVLNKCHLGGADEAA